VTTLFLAGDVMTGRGIDQVLRTSADPALHEPHVRDARRYVELAQAVSGPIPRPVGPEYVWGDALGELDRIAPAVRIVNLETAITTNPERWSTKSIHYRMHPSNVDVLTAAGIDVCVLANNHVLDWGVDGLRETLRTLAKAGIRTTGAGEGPGQAAEPAAVAAGDGRIVVHAWATPDAGAPSSWAPGPERPGVNVLGEGTAAAADRVIDAVDRSRRSGDRVVVSLHWGGNWGYDVPAEQRALAHRLIDAGAADIVFGHSSHHPKGIEVYGDRLILYGAGDLLNDYEGIGGREAFRADLAMLYFPELAASGSLESLTLVPVRIRRFRLQAATPDETAWLVGRLDRESRRLGASVTRVETGRLSLRW
jgi:poly-gamma-glutamate capsule biosynthesis protein CapA/YwtB (metallophosphatase superfamily)